MNPAQIHLALNHAPLFLSVISAVILGTGLLRKNESFIQLSLAGLIAAALFTLPVFFTGEGTEELVEKAAGVQETMIEAHENMAKAAFAVMLAGGAAALLAIVFSARQQIRRVLLPAVLILSLVSFVLMGQTAHLGGQIRHTEIQAAAIQGTDNGEQKKEGDTQKKGTENKEKDDD